ncbi:MAG: ABC transporter permease, partial [Anaerolineae bacterium]|nr:ABC transporter permease [Anaerolineae bacterium]
MRRRDVLLAAIGVIILWQGLAWGVRRDVLPTPYQVFRALLVELPRGLGYHFLVSAWRVVASVAVAVITAVPAGLILGQSPRLNRVFSPIIYIIYPIPKIVFLPIILLFLGVGDRSKIFIIALILFFQVLVVVRDEAGGIRPELLYSV